MITFSHSGDFKHTDKFLKRMSHGQVFEVLHRYGNEGVLALRKATPLDSGETANSWTYEIVNRGGTYSIIWDNTHIIDGRPIAILIQYGHGTRNGGYVMGRDYINPALRPIFDQILSSVWKEVTAA